MSIVGHTRAGGLRLGLRALGTWAGCSNATWFTMACIAAAGSRPPGAWKRHPASTHGRAIAGPERTKPAVVHS